MTHPIVYIRGYAMGSGEVEATFNMPYYGFNLGSTQVRVARDEKPSMRIFESPVVRLIKDEGYLDAFNRFVDSRNSPIPDSVPSDGEAWRRTLWIFRFYDAESRVLGSAERGEIEDYAEALAIFLDEVRKACGDPEGFAVNLVAHSMGGLVARCYLQNKGLFKRKGLTGRKPVNVRALFTYGSPHRGISFRRGLGWAENVRDLVGVAGSDTFGEKRIREFLSLKADDDLYDYSPLPHAPPIERVFCVVGTNYQDYVVWVSKKAVGPGSDGLVVLENAYVHGAARAYIHRAHSGPFGMVNSEEGYQNLTRFLFGDVRFEATLEPIEVQKDLPGLGKDDTLDHLEIEVDVAIRGLPVYIQSRHGGSQSAIVVKMTRAQGGDGYRQEAAAGGAPEPTPLFTGFLRGSKRMAGDDLMRGALDLRVIPHYSHSGWIRTSRFEGEAMLSDRLHLGIDPGISLDAMEGRWASLTRPVKGRREGNSVLFPLPTAAGRYLSGKGLRIRLTPWGAD